MSGTTGCSDLLATCLANLSYITSEYGNCTCQEDECADSDAGDFNLALHIVCVFVILLCSMLGAATPILTEKVPYSWTPVVIVYGKCMGTGVVIAVGVIHMLQPSNEALSSPCLPAGFTVYNYAYLFCMASSLFLHLVDFLLSRWMHSLAEKGGPQIGHAHGPGGEEIEEHSHDHHHDSVVPVGSTDTYFDQEFGERAPPSTPQPTDQVTKAVPIMEEPKASKEQVQRIVGAYMLEFAVTIHSVFIGLPVGVADQNSLNALFVALAFHQFFEGVALGCRIVDAKLTVWNDIILTLIFSIAAPIGIGIGIGVRSSLNPNSVTFLLVQGTFDGICAGFLVFIGYALLIIDFPRDMAKVCTGKWKHWLEFGMFAAVWTGAGVMAGLGYYL